MPELEIKEVLTAFVKVFNEIEPISDKVVISFLSRMEDLLNHLNSYYLQFSAEIDALKIRVERLESFGKKFQNIVGDIHGPE